MLVAIPSKNRPDKVKSQKVIPSATVFVPKSEASAYEKCGVKNVVAVPSSVKGITRTRNWILDYALERKERHVVYIDDDVKCAGWRELHEQATSHHNMTEGQWLTEFAKLFGITEAMRFRVWGVSTQSSARAILPWRPFIFRAYVTASCMGIVNDAKRPLRFDETYPVKEDYELCLRAIRDDGGVVAARYLYWENLHWQQDGGCKDYRTQAMEEDCILRLMKTYPNMIRRVTRGGSKYSIELSF